MGEHKTLKKALRQMAEGSKSGFHTFYLGTSQYVYSSALLLYDSHEDACRFMVDFYQYLYLHLPAYDRSANLENWIARLLMERYEQLSIGKNMPQPSVKQKMNSVVSQLSKSEQERIWRMLDVNIHFPKENVHRSPIKIALFVSALLLALLVASRYVPAAIEQLRTAFSASKPAKTDDNVNASDSDSNEDTNDPDSDTETENESQADELDSIRDDLENLLNEQRNTGADNSGNDSDILQQQQADNPNDTDETSTSASPAEPDTPQEPDPPKEPQSPSLSEQSQNGSASGDLDDLELQLRYGDSLLFADPDTDSN